MDLETLRRRLGELGARTVRLEWSDLHGLSRGKRLSVDAFLASAHSGFSFSSAALCTNLRGDVAPLALGPMNQEWGNFVARPLLETLRPLPLEPRSCQVLADLETPEGEPVLESPRLALKTALDQAARRGFGVTVGLELEFYLFADDQCQVLRPGRQVYRTLQGEAEKRFVEAADEVFRAMGLAVEAVFPEDAPGQLEVVLQPGPALEVADSAFLAKNLIKETARNQGLFASFLSKPLAGESGCGFHFHQSLTYLETGAAAFHDPSQEHGVSAVLRGYLAGQLRGLREAAGFYLPTVNAYKRILSRDTGCLSATWGFDNRTAALRVVGSSPDSLRLENRVPGGDANPYLAIAAALGTGLAGIDEGLEPPPPTRGNAYIKGSRETALPTSLREALRCLHDSSILRRALGPSAVDRFLALKWDEVHRFERAITDWEREEYLEFL